MSESKTQSSQEPCKTTGLAEPARAQLLNQHCYCQTLNTEALHNWVAAQSLPHNFLEILPRFFSSTAVFISESQRQKIHSIVNAISNVVNQKKYQETILPDQVISEQGITGGVFMGYDFHLHENGPRLIEINTNAGGGFLNAVLLGVQTACCNVANSMVPVLRVQIEAEFIAMFRREWQLARGDLPLRVIAIVDENPAEQFLYPEFLLAQQLLQQAGIKTLIVNATDLEFMHGQLQFERIAIDMVYNRLTDFSLDEPCHQALRQAYEQDAVVVTPNPLHHALYADKRNLCILSNAELMGSLGINDKDIETLCAGIPYTQTISSENAEQLWQERKTQFFKPATGFGSRAAYRGDKVTRRVWEEILQGNYVAQQQIPPSERGILVDGEQTALKIDIRTYVYDGKVQLLAARLYQGQTTNFRTQGGGFAPVFVI